MPAAATHITRSGFLCCELEPEHRKLTRQRFCATGKKEMANMTIITNSATSLVSMINSRYSAALDRKTSKMARSMTRTNIVVHCHSSGRFSTSGCGGR